MPPKPFMRLAAPSELAPANPALLDRRQLAYWLEALRYFASRKGELEEENYNKLIASTRKSFLKTLHEKINSERAYAEWLQAKQAFDREVATKTGATSFYTNKRMRQADRKLAISCRTILFYSV
jgi:hypothetical protein